MILILKYLLESIVMMLGLVDIMLRLTASLLLWDWRYWSKEKMILFTLWEESKNKEL